MARCRKCGCKLVKGAEFCSECGAAARRSRRPSVVVPVILLVACVACATVFGLSRFGLLSSGSLSDTYAQTSRIGSSEGSFVQIHAGAVDDLVTDKDAAFALVSQIGATFGIADASKELSEQSVQQGLGNTFYRFSQCYEGIPVYGRSVIVGADSSGRVLGITSNYRALEDVATTPKVSEEEAMRAALGDAEGTSALGASLCIYSLGDVEPTLAWQLMVNDGNAPLRVFVNALDGSVIAEESLAHDATLDVGTTDGSTKTINVSEQGDGNYALIDEERNLHVYDANEHTVSYTGASMVDELGRTYSISIDGDEWTIANDEGSLFDGVFTPGNYLQIVDASGKTIANRAYATEWEYQADGVTIHPVAESVAYLTGDGARNAVSLQSYLSETIDFYGLLFERNSFDDAGGRVDGIANVRLLNSEGEESSLNASTHSYPHTSFIFYGRDLAVSYEVVAHELTHSLEQSISGLGSVRGEGLTGETGALKEAISDLIAVAAEDYANDSEFNNDCDWAMQAMRNLADPLSGFDGLSRAPEKYQGELWGDPDNPNNNNDNGYIHNNSTVISHAGYLMCMGEDIEGDALTTGQLAQLTYLTLFSLPTDCTFSQFRVIMENTAEAMVEQGMLTGSQSVRVAEAFFAVEIPRVDDLYGVTKDATLQVLDINNEPFADYTVIVTPWSWFWRAYQTDDAYELTPESADPLPLNFPGSGTYQLDIVDRNNPYLQWGARVSVGWLRDETEIKLYTSLGDYEEDAEQNQVAEGLPTETAASEPGTRDVALVLDVSGSMNGSPIEQMKAAAKEFVGTALEGKARVGVVFYESEAMILQGLSSDETRLTAAIDELGGGGDTNMEDGLAKGGQTLGTSNADRRIIVLMSDGAPNVGKTGDDLVAYAGLLKDRGCKIYTVGFNEGADGYALLSAIASEGCHYEVRNEEDLAGFFSDIADEISGTRFMYVRAACPVDVEVAYDGETLSSAPDALTTRTSFGTLAFEDEVDESGAVTMEDGVKVLRLKEGPAYDVRITGTGEGEMDYTIGFADDVGDYSDFRSFEGIDITPSTRIDTTAAVSDTTRLVVDEDGDGMMDLAYEAGANERAAPVDNRLLVYLTMGGCVVVAASFGTALYGFSRWRKQRAA
jgi:Zn-dependent metalloprotease/Mg-chelatase subunit ChlD